MKYLPQMREQVVGAVQALYRYPRHLAVLVLGLCLAWVYWPSVVILVGAWETDPHYSHGFVVPMFALYLLWRRRDLAKDLQPSGWGLPVLMVGLALRFTGTYLYFDWLRAIALLPMLAGLCLLGGGGRALRWGWPSIAFCIFMVPLPFRLETALAGPLQSVATHLGTYILQTIGFIAYAEGNVIHLGQVRIGVVEACSGLSMMMIFFALSTAVCLIIERPLGLKILIIASAVPIAIASNLVRIVVTAILHKTVGSELADYVFHDLAGWLMMPLALLLLWAELRVLAWLMIDVEDKEKLPPRIRTLVPRGGGLLKSGGVRKPAGTKITPEKTEAGMTNLQANPLTNPS